MSFKRSRVCFISKSKTALLRSPFSNTLTSCNSAVIAQAQNLSNNLKLIPPGWHLMPPHSDRDYLEPWGDYLCEAVFRGQLLTHQDEVIFMGEVPQEFFEAQTDLSQFEIVTKTNFIEQIYPETVLQKYFGVKTDKHETKLKIAFVNFSMGVANTDQLQPKLQLAGLFTGIYYRGGDQWSHYRINLGQVPSVEELQQFDVLVMSGSYCSIKDKDPYIVQFREVLKKLLKQNKTIRIHAACFGHQLLCDILGIDIFRHKTIIGPERVKFTPPSNLTLQSLRTIFQQGSFKIYEEHRDSAQKVPPGFIRVGSSETCQVQAILSKDQRIFTTQFHPQYSDPYMKDVRNRIAAYSGKQPDPKDEIILDQEHLEDHQTFRKAVRAFIQGK